MQLVYRIAWLSALLSFTQVKAQETVSKQKAGSVFTLVDATDHPVILTDSTDEWLVNKTASFLQSDIEKVSGKQLVISHQLPIQTKTIVLIGSIEHSVFIRQLTEQHKLSTNTLKGKWEAYRIAVVEHPFPGIDKALVIAGSDKRGAAYGVFELSRLIGVSPWYWWADVPVLHKEAIYLTHTIEKQDQPKVTYRGIFINDEAPAFSGWTKEKFGGVNHLVYEKIFELLLRLKANYLWPAMWGNAFNDDDTLNPVLADKYGIVMGTSHHEPMLRAQQEWKRYGKGQWNYQTNDSTLRDFWRKGIEHMGTHESIVTIGMRGDGDMPMTKGSNISLLERIVADQRKIIEEVTGKPAAATPQSWALYKEVQDYYDKGMRVPDDVTLLLCDDNWGNLRKLPHLGEPPRKGGYGIYYHFDYVGGPRNYKWLNTNPLPRVWEQMHLAYAYGVSKIWIVNVGDLKPMELPISFFLDYAWNPDAIGPTGIQSYTNHWAAQQFGKAHAAEIGGILAKYAKYNGRRKPELLNENTYSLENYAEAKRVTDAYLALNKQAARIASELHPVYHNAFFELVQHPVEACSNLQALYYHTALNHAFARQHNTLANAEADTVKLLYEKDSLISVAYNTLSDGKWNHMMDQTHIGYTYWQQPFRQRIPKLQLVTDTSGMAALSITAKASNLSAHNLIPAANHGPAFYEKDGYVSIEANHASRIFDTKTLHWQVLPDLGKTGDAMTVFPVTVPDQEAGNNNPHIDYDVFVYDTGHAELSVYFAPTLNFRADGGLRFAVSIDEQPLQEINLNKEDNNTRVWESWVANDIIIKTTQHHLMKPGKHTVHLWMISPAVVFEKLVLNMGGARNSYLGPPETIAR